MHVIHECDVNTTTIPEQDKGVFEALNKADSLKNAPCLIYNKPTSTDPEVFFSNGTIGHNSETRLNDESIDALIFMH